MKVRLLPDKAKFYGSKEFRWPKLYYLTPKKHTGLQLIFLFLICLGTSAFAYGTRWVTEDIQLSEALNKLSQKYEVFFSYDEKMIEDVEVSYNPEHYRSIEHALNELLAGTSLRYKIFDNRYIILYEESKEALTSLKGMVRHLESVIDSQEKSVKVRATQKPVALLQRSFAQQIEPLAFNVSGTVTDQNGEPLIGVNIQVKGTNTGTSTDFEGNFTLDDIDENAVLVLSYIGYQTQEVAVAGKSNLTITMLSDSQLLDEVVVVGYGTMKKSDLTGSVVSADISAFRESPNTSITQSLHGSVAGLNIGQVSSSGENPSILIRGQNSFSKSNTAPLIVLDGIIYEGSIVDINPSDVESVEILKDASSSAIYGSRASNGVIIISTKKGADYGKPILNYTGSYTIQSPSSVPRLMNREEYIQSLKDVYWNEAYLAPDFTEPNPDFDTPSYWQRPQIIEAYELGSEFDWWDASTQTGHINEHNLSMRGKSELTSYYISAGYTDQLGYIMNDKYKRYNVRLNVENKVFDWITMGVQSFITSSDYSGRTPHMGNIFIESPLNTPYDEDGNYLQFPSDLPARNPFFNSEADDLSKRMNLFGNFYTDIRVPFVEGLSYRLNYSQNYQTNRNFYFNKYDNNFTGGSYKNNDSQYRWTLDNILTYQKDINRHNIQSTLVVGREESEYESSQAESEEFDRTELGYNKLDVGGIPRVYSGGWNESSLYYMGRFHYGYNKKYLATFTIRRDGFSGFSSLNKFGIFPSGAVAWVTSEEEFFMNGQNFFNFLKLRASYGSVGNRTLGRYGTLSKVNTFPGYVFGQGSSPYLVQGIQNLGNSGLSWETTTSFNLGVDFSILNDRINGSLDYYNSNTRDILYSISIPEITGFNSISENIGKVHNTGIETSLTGTVIKQKDLAWNVTLNFWRNRNKIVSILGLDLNNDGIEDDLVADQLFIGEPLGVVYNYVVEGLYQIGDEDIPNGFHPGQYRFKDLNGDGDITPEFDRTINGYTDPDYRFSINNHIQFKNWSLRLFINSVQGGKDRYFGQNHPNFGYHDNVTHWNKFIWDWWTPSNPDAKYPQLFNETPVAKSYRNYDQRSFIRLQDLSLSYIFNPKILNEISIQNIKIYLSGKNLITWTKWQGWDPETGQGIVRGGTPVLKTYTIGLDFSF